MTEQQRYQVRFDWALAGAASVADDADVVVWIDELQPVPAPLEELPERAAVVETGLEGAAETAEWILALQETLQRRTMVALIAAGAPRDGGIRFAAEDLLAAGAVVDALEARGIDAYSPEAAVADAAFRTLRPAVRSLTAAVVASSSRAGERQGGFLVRRPHPRAG